MTSQPPPAISPIPEGEKPRPFWSVMVPAYNPRADYLEQTLRSALVQHPGSELMQIEVVDDCSPGVNVAAIVKSIAGERMQFSKTSKNLGLAGCWNTCIERSRGQWVHILHQDDYVLPGFYATLAQVAEHYPKVGLLATRSFYVDVDGVISGVTGRLKKLENGGCTVDDFFYGTPIQCAGVVVKRSAYEEYGGFRSDLTLTLDCEMWARVIAMSGGSLTPEVLSCYRISGINESARLSQTAEGVRDVERLNQLFAAKYPGFDCKRAVQRLCDMALRSADYFSKSGNFDAATANRDYWRKRAPASLRLRRFAEQMGRHVFRL